MQFITTPERVGRMEGFQEGLQKGEATMLIRLLQRRFGQLPPKYLAQVQQSGVDTLLVWCERVLDAKTLEEVFD